MATVWSFLGNTLFNYRHFLIVIYGHVITKRNVDFIDRAAIKRSIAQSRRANFSFRNCTLVFIIIHNLIDPYSNIDLTSCANNLYFWWGKCIKGSTHYLGDKQDFDVSSKGPSSGISRKRFRRNLVYRLTSESILFGR